MNNSGSSEEVLTIEASDAIIPSRKGLDKSALASVTPENFVFAQKNCPALKELWLKAEKDEETEFRIYKQRLVRISVSKRGKEKCS